MSREPSAPLMRDPVWVYDIWSAYTDGIYEHEAFGGLEDKTRLTEALCLKQLGELARLDRHGVHFDAFMMNAFWFDPVGAYRTWRKPDWPDGPDRWIAVCQAQGLKPGLWFGTNSLWKIDAAPQWRDSLAVRRASTDEVMSLESMSFYEGGFLPDFMSTLQHWYDRGIRLFEFDAADFDAATPAATQNQSLQEIRDLNQTAFSDALKDFRCRNPDVMLVAFNDFGGDIFTTATPFPFRKPVDLRWLEVFETLYTGDTRVSDVPLVNFWRSVDLFNDHMTRRYEQAGVPLERTDPFFTLSSTWFGYKRGKRAWKGMLLLSAARGNWKKTIYGNLELLDDEDARWFAKVQKMYAPVLAMGRTKTFGGIPGEAKPYGFGSCEPSGSLYTVVNPTQTMCSIDLPRLAQVQEAPLEGRILFRDAGFAVQLSEGKVLLGPEQMAVLGFGCYTEPQYDLGLQQDSIIPLKIAALEESSFIQKGNVIETTIMPPSKGDLRILMQQRAADGTAPRSPFIKIEAEQAGKAVPVEQPDRERALSTGISWAAGEIRQQSLAARELITIRCISPEKRSVTLTGQIYVVEFS